jgi:hypothetical protein
MTVQENMMKSQLPEVKLDQHLNNSEGHQMEIFCSRLAGTTLQARPAFKQSLEQSIAICLASQSNKRWKSPLLWDHLLPRAVLLGAALTFVMVASLIIAVPRVRAEVDRLVQQLGFVLTDEYPDVHITSSGYASPSDPSPWMSFEEAQRLAPFSIRLPQWLPGKLALDGIGTFPNQPDALGNPPQPYQVIAHYQEPGSAQSPSPWVILDMRPASVSGGYMIDASKVRSIEVNGQSALYAKGSWDGNGKWQDDADEAYLTWEMGGVKYSMSASGISEQDMIQIAESIR